MKSELLNVIVETKSGSKNKTLVVEYDEAKFSSAQDFYDTRLEYTKKIEAEQSKFNLIHNEFIKEQQKFRQLIEGIDDVNKYGKIDIYDPNNVPQSIKNKQLEEKIKQLEENLKKK